MRHLQPTCSSNGSEVGYRIVVSTGGRRCAFLDLRGYALILKLWSPIYAENVSLDTEFDE